jgi:hypothetical protein
MAGPKNPEGVHANPPPKAPAKKKSPAITHPEAPIREHGQAPVTGPSAGRHARLPTSPSTRASLVAEAPIREHGQAPVTGANAGKHATYPTTGGGFNIPPSHSASYYATAPAVRVLVAPAAYTLPLSFGNINYGQQTAPGSYYSSTQGSVAAATGADTSIPPPLSTSSEVITYRGVKMTRAEKDRLLLAEKLAGRTLLIYQGGYSGVIAASASTHLEDALDVGPATPGVLNALRKAGFAAWIRTPAEGFDPHIHAVPLPGGGVRLSEQARAQVSSYEAGGTGLVQGGRDPYARPTPLQQVRDAIAGRKSRAAAPKPKPAAKKAAPARPSPSPATSLQPPSAANIGPLYSELQASQSIGASRTPNLLRPLIPTKTTATGELIGGIAGIGEPSGYVAPEQPVTMGRGTATEYQREHGAFPRSSPVSPPSPEPTPKPTPQPSTPQHRNPQRDRPKGKAPTRPPGGPATPKPKGSTSPSSPGGQPKPAKTPARQVGTSKVAPPQGGAKPGSGGTGGGGGGGAGAPTYTSPEESTAADVTSDTQNDQAQAATDQGQYFEPATLDAYRAGGVFGAGIDAPEPGDVTGPDATGTHPSLGSIGKYALIAALIVGGYYLFVRKTGAASSVKGAFARFTETSGKIVNKG